MSKTGDLQVVLLTGAQIRRQVILDRADEIGDRIERRGFAWGPSRGKAQPLANDVRLRDLAFARLGVDLSPERFWQSYGKRLHVGSV